MQGRRSLRAVGPTMTYYHAKTIDGPFAAAIDRAIAALKAHGFGVLTRIDSGRGVVPATRSGR
jgi:uncharacterized protein (DUF302 family)